MDAKLLLETTPRESLPAVLTDRILGYFGQHRAMDRKAWNEAHAFVEEMVAEIERRTARLLGEARAWNEANAVGEIHG